MTKEKYENFIIRVFDYYNGRINIFNKAKLIISWASTNVSHKAGFTKFPNLVMIHAGSLMGYTNKYGLEGFDYDQYLYCITIETIIHELFHVDQIINYRLYEKDMNYNQYIENSVDFMTYSYIASNLHDIYTRFGVIISYNNTVAAMNQYIGYYYQRKDINYHIAMMLYDIESDIDLHILMNILASPDGHVIVSFEDKTYHLKDGMRYLSADDINDIFGKYYYKYDFKEYYSGIIYGDNTITLKLTDINMKRTMVII